MFIAHLFAVREQPLYFCYIQFLTLICLISHRIASCPIVKTQETRDKDFCLNRNGFLIRFSSFCFNCTGHFFVNFSFFRQRFPKLKFSKPKSPRIDPFVSFPFNLLRNRRKNRQRTEREKSDGRSSERKKESSLGTG